MKPFLLILLILSTVCRASAQEGLYEYTLKLANGKTIHRQRAEPYFKYGDYNCYWFAKPGQDRYFFCNNIGDMGITLLRGRGNDTSFTYRDKYQGAQVNFVIADATGTAGICHPDPGSPMTLHYNIFSPSEISLSFNGPVEYVDGKSVSNNSKGTINGTIHLYREGKYEHSDQAPGCNCNPTLYAYSYNPEIGRTPTDCENAVLWRIYNTIQLSLSRVIPGISYTGGENNPPPHSIIYNGTKGGLDISGPLSTVSPCNADNPPRASVNPEAHKRTFTFDNFALYFLKKPSGDDLAQKGTANMQNAMKGYMAFADSLTKLYQAKKISAEQETKLMDARMKQMSANTGQPDIDKMETEYNFSIRVIINALTDQGSALGLTAAYLYPVVQHKVPGASFEVMVPGVKDGDGHWTKNKLYIFFGTFNVILSGTGVKSIIPLYDAAGNKLTLFNTIMLLDGGTDMIDKAIANIDFSVIPSLLQTPHYN